MTFFLIGKAVHWKSACIFLSLLFVRFLFGDTLFFDYQRLPLQAVLLLVPKNISASCITNATRQVECTESFSSPIHVHQYQAPVDALG